MTIFTWTIKSLPARSSIDGQSNVIIEVHWTCTASVPAEIVGEVYVPARSAVYHSTTPVTYTAGQSFTPYNELTEDQIWSWINPTIDRTAIETSLQANIDTQLQPATVNLALPWQ